MHGSMNVCTCAAGHTVRSHWSMPEHAALKDPLPEALIISLDRLPSPAR